jgi:hypothetical protein
VSVKLEEGSLEAAIMANLCEKLSQEGKDTLRELVEAGGIVEMRKYLACNPKPVAEVHATITAYLEAEAAQGRRMMPREASETMWREGGHGHQEPELVWERMFDAHSGETL